MSFSQYHQTFMRKKSGRAVVLLAALCLAARATVAQMPPPAQSTGIQLTWTAEPGIRIGPGAPVLTESAEHPFAIANADGSMTLYYGKFTGGGGASSEGLYHSISAGGLTFEQESYDVFFGNDPDVLRLSDGTLALYYGQFSPQVDGTINLARCPDPAADAAVRRP
jgi:hypothetical protein